MSPPDRNSHEAQASRDQGTGTVREFTAALPAEASQKMRQLAGGFNVVNPMINNCHLDMVSI
eukprot:s281_g27.t1